jgi:signal transduction histidine kinase
MPELESAIAFYAPEAVGPIRNAVERARQTGEPWDLELPFITATGRRIWVRAVGRVAMENGRPVRSFGAFQDISRQRQMQEAAREAQQQLLELQKLETERVEVELAKTREQLVAQTRLATIGQVSASIAHELRNPLGAVRNAAYYLNQRFGSLDEKLREYLEIIDNEISVSDRIINNLMGMARGAVLQKASVGIHDLMREVAGIVQLPRGVSMVFSPEARSKRVWADPIQLRQILTNLVMNSVQALEGNGRIDVDAISAGEYDAIVIRDNGPGIPVQQRSHLFEPLFTTKAKGTGLGLALCRQIVRQHGGELEYVDEVDQGAAFRIRLPKQPGDPVNS